MAVSDSPRHSVSVAAAVVNAEGKILAIRRRDTGKWEPPGGILELEAAPRRSDSSRAGPRLRGTEDTQQGPRLLLSNAE